MPGADRGKGLALVNGLARSCTVLALALGGVAESLLGPRGSFAAAGSAGLLVAVWAGVSLHRTGALHGAVPLARDAIHQVGPTP
jgi:hypothetical protein